MTLYLAAIYFACDFAYTKFLYEKDRSGRISHDDYHHGLTANFEGYETWGRLRSKLYTNSLGFKDGKIRDVPGGGRHEADSSDRRFIHRGRRAGVRADVRRHAVSGRTKARRENRIPQRRRDLLFPHHLLQEDQVSARRGPQVRRGRGVVGPVRRAGRGDRLFLHRRACGIPAVLHRASLQLDRQAHAHPGPRPPRAAESRSEVQGQLRHDGPAAADVLA